MDPLNVTVISCLYGGTHIRFLREWVDGIGRLNPAPRETILSTDRCRFIPEVNAVAHRMNGDWRHPQAFHLNQALGLVETEWIWIHDVDDVAFPDALADIDEGTADVFQMGYRRSDGEEHLPSAFDLLNLDDRNGFVAGSMVRTSALRDIGGFRDVALQDWDLWRRLVKGGSFFAFSDRPRFYYRRHPATRGARELTVLDRARHMAEMEAA